MKLKKLKGISSKVSCLVLMAVLLSSNTINAQAAIQDKPNKKIKVKNILENSQLNKFESIPEVQEKIDLIKKVGKDAQQKTSYIKITKSPDGKTTSKTFSENDFSNEFLNDVVQNRNFISQPNSWIKLSLEAYNSGGNDYFLVGGYTWIKDPLFNLRDVFSVGHDSTATFNTGESFSYHQSPWHGPSTGGGPMYYNDKQQDYDGTSYANCKRDTLGVAYKFNLESTYCNHPYTSDPEYGAQHYPFGMIYVDAKVNQEVGSNLQVSYAHQEFGLNYDINDAIQFLQNGSISPKVESLEDVFTVGDRLLP